MLWQDLVITAATLVFGASLIPQIYHGFKKKKGFVTLATSGPTFIGLYAITIAFFTLPLFFSSIMSLITGTLWLILFLQGLKYKKL